MEQWGNMWLKGLKFTLSSRLKDNFHKMMYHWYITSEKIAKMYKNILNNCWKCDQQEGAFYYLW